MRAPAILLAMLVATPAAAQVTSDRIEGIAVTLYRDPERREAAIPARGWPGGYALITETRTISIPAGPATIRFEGVSEGMMPETAIVTGLPRAVGEKNRDARLISPAALIDAYLKRRVTIRRTDRATGRVTESAAVIQSGPAGGVLLTTSDGVEALGCSGLPEGVRYPGVPADLAAKPTLSVTTDSKRAATVTVQLSYLAQGFDWAASYVARVAADGTTLDLFAWMTIANGGSQGFARAATQAVAGAPNKEQAAPRPASPEARLELRCWPMDITSTHPKRVIERTVWPPPPPSAAEAGDQDADIVVSAQRRGAAMDSVVAVTVVMTAQLEQLGDLKLYRIPEPVTVAALSRKQVALIDRKRVAIERVYGASFEEIDYDRDAAAAATASVPARRLLRTTNIDGKGLGLPLPAGNVAVFEQAGGQSLLVGESEIGDRAVGQEVELDTGESGDVRYGVTARAPSARRKPYSVVVTNARTTPETFELVIPYKLASSSADLIERKGLKTWRVVVPAGGEAKLDLALRLEPEAT